MPLSYVSPLITTRFREAQDVLSYIRRHESVPPQPDAAEVTLLRGLFYVHLYGAFEFSVNQVVQAVVEAINQAKAPHSQIVRPLGALVLDSHFSSIASASPKNQWAKRIDVMQVWHSTQPARIDDGVIELQNIWLQTIQLIYRVFGNQRSYLKDITKSGYIRELVDTRSKIAHGEESPSISGRKRNSADLQRIYDAILGQSNYMLDCFNDYVRNGEFLLPP